MEWLLSWSLGPAPSSLPSQMNPLRRRDCFQTRPTLVRLDSAPSGSDEKLLPFAQIQTQKKNKIK